MSAPAVVLDLGSYNCRGGFAGDEIPKVSFRTEAIAEQPFASRTIVNFDNYKIIVKHMYKELGVEPSKQAAYMTDASMSSLETRQKIAQFFFEELKVPAIYIAPSFTYAAMSAGYSNALLIDMGESSTEIAAICEGYFVKSTVTKHIITGRVIAECLQKALKVDREKIDEIKKGLLQVSMNFDEEMEKAQTPVEFNGIKVGQERAIAAELYFKPFFEELDSDGFAEDIKSCINRATMTTRKELWERIFLFGGAAQIKGLPERLKAEVAPLAPPAIADRVNVSLTENPESFAWVGASVYASTHPEAAILKYDYDEVGPNIIRDNLMK
jgi:actin-related protein